MTKTERRREGKGRKGSDEKGKEGDKERTRKGRGGSRRRRGKETK